MKSSTTVAVALAFVAVIGLSTVAVADQTREVQISAEGSIEAGTNVTLTGQINGTAAPGLNVTVNDDRVGTTDANGSIVVEVPDAAEMTVNMSNDTAAGERVFAVESANTTDGNATDGNATDGNVTDGNTTDGNATDGNATDGNATDEPAAEFGGPSGEPPADLAGFTATRPASEVSPDSLSGKIRVESDLASEVSVNLTRNSSTEYSLAITAPDSAENVTFFLQSRAVESSQNISNVTMYLDGQRQEFYVDPDAGPGNSPWIAFEVDHFSTRNVTFSSDSSTDGTSQLSGAAATFDGNGDGRIAISELGNAAVAFANGQLSISELGNVATAFAS